MWGRPLSKVGMDSEELKSDLESFSFNRHAISKHFSAY